MKQKIAVLPGDGIGPEVIQQSIKVLDAVADRFGHFFEYCFSDVGAIAIEKTGDPLPEMTLETCLQADAVLFGAIGDPKYDQDPTLPVRPEQGLLRLRKELELFANIRPVEAYYPLLRLSPLKEEYIRDVDFVIFRELTGDLYFGEKKREGDTAEDQCIYHRSEVERIARLAFDRARLRKKHVTLVDKANVLETSRLWRETVTALAEEYVDVQLDWMYVDNAAMQIIQNPRRFDVILTSNMFGDILSDEASVLTGSMGLLPSSSIGGRTSLYEPIHGSFPQAAGENTANPIAAILSAAMMLEDAGLVQETALIRKAVGYVLAKGMGTPDLKPSMLMSCNHLGDMIAHLVEEEDEYAHIRDEKVNERLSTII